MEHFLTRIEEERGLRERRREQREKEEEEDLKGNRALQADAWLEDGKKYSTKNRAPDVWMSNTIVRGKNTKVEIEEPLNVITEKLIAALLPRETVSQSLKRLGAQMKGKKKAQIPKDISDQFGLITDCAVRIMSEGYPDIYSFRAENLKALITPSDEKKLAGYFH